MKRPVRKSDLEVTHVRGSGPGGQNRNKRMSGVRVKHKATGIVVTATERRSQAQNQAAAMERLDEKIQKHFHRPKSRRATRPTGGAREERLKRKSGRSKSKALRQRVRDSDW